MDIRVVMGEAKPCPNLARRLAMVYDLLLRRAEEAEAGSRIEKHESLVATAAEASEEPDFNKWNSKPARPANLEKLTRVNRNLTKRATCDIL